MRRRRRRPISWPCNISRNAFIMATAVLQGRRVCGAQALKATRSFAQCSQTALRAVHRPFESRPHSRAFGYHRRRWSAPWTHDLDDAYHIENNLWVLNDYNEYSAVTTFYKARSHPRTKPMLRV